MRTCKQKTYSSRCLIALTFLLFNLPSVFAQTVTNNNNTGYPQNAIVQGTEIESVQVTNGNLHIEIPIYRAKGRGQDTDTGSKFLLDSKGWGFTTQCGQGICTDHPSPDFGSNVTLTARSLQNYDVRYQGSDVSCIGTYMYSLKSNLV